VVLVRHRWPQLSPTGDQGVRPFNTIIEVECDVEGVFHGVRAATMCASVGTFAEALQQSGDWRNTGADRQAGEEVATQASDNRQTVCVDHIGRQPGCRLEAAHAQQGVELAAEREAHGTVGRYARTRQERALSPFDKDRRDAETTRRPDTM
jgi:hypothetical protein